MSVTARYAHRELGSIKAACSKEICSICRKLDAGRAAFRAVPRRLSRAEVRSLAASLNAPEGWAYV